ncbi:NAD(P)/FAD-dependent oxidoreductase [Enterococcus sp.]|uniref:NAD(P)/FAD-dependent oxidoreductase n=1 Tax=Enterococcus sp. TaxID=35783 RepID=UPI0028A10DD6|nr:NAD(P)/FAD-dependent oxidoreductase [Enterococcus sp.]
MTTIADVLIIGGGPTGLYASFYAGLRDLSVVLFEAQAELGGKINFYPEKMVWDVGALPPTKGKKVKEHLIEQAKLFDPTIYLKTKIISLTKEDDLFYAVDDQGRTHVGRTVLVCIGGGVVSPQKLPCFIHNNVDNYIHYQFPDQQAIQGKHLVISGGGDAAVDYAIEAVSYGAKVTLCYRGEKLKAHEAQVKKMKAEGIQVLMNHTIDGVNQAETFNMVLRLKNSANHETIDFLCDHLLIQHGYDRDSGLLDKVSFDLARHEDFYLNCEIPTKTSHPGVFAAGYIHYFKGKVNLLAGAFQDAAQAVNQIKHYLEPTSVPQAMVSSHNEKFSERNRQLLVNE